MDNPRYGYMVDGKPVRKFLFTRWISFIGAYQLCMVEAFDKDHAVKRLVEHYKGSESREWELIDECAPEHFIGRQMGETLELVPLAQRQGAITWRKV